MLVPERRHAVQPARALRIVMQARALSIVLIWLRRTPGNERDRASLLARRRSHTGFVLAAAIATFACAPAAAPASGLSSSSPSAAASTQPAPSATHAPAW